MKAPHAISLFLFFAIVSLCMMASVHAAYDGSMPEDKVKPPTTAQRWVFSTPGGHLAFVPYGPNVIRVTYTTGADDTLVPSGWGTIASPSGETAWSLADGTLKSSAMVLKVDKANGTFTATRPDGHPICQYLGGNLTPVTLSGQPTLRVELRVYPGADGASTIYSDDGHTYAYETGEYQVVVLHYDDKTKSVQISGASSLLPADLHPHIVEPE